MPIIVSGELVEAKFGLAHSCGQEITHQPASPLHRPSSASQAFRTQLAQRDSNRSSQKYCRTHCYRILLMTRCLDCVTQATLAILWT